MKKIIVMCLLGAMSVFIWGCSSQKKEEPSEVFTTETREASEAASTEAAASSEEAGSGEELTTETASTEALTETDSLDDTLKNAVNGFNWKLYEEAGDENLFYSAYSIESAIAMADLGASGETKSEIESVLGIDDIGHFSEQYKLFRERENSEKAKLTTANSVWIDNSLKMADNVDEDFNRPAELYFGGELRSVDFRNNADGVKSEISDWVKEKTENLISDYESIASSDTVADILNAVYFYGEWQSKFGADKSYSEEFNGKTGTTNVDMMHNDDGYFRYLADKDGVTAIALPYGEGKVEMDILMSSDTAKDITDVLKADNADGVFDALDSSGEKEVELTLPKFSMDISFDGLDAVLKKLGMKAAFSEGADFSKLAENLYVSGISHRAKIEVDEEGSRAAAVTEMTMETTAFMPEEEKIVFKADRPFVFVIRDKESGVILFTGRVMDL